MREGQFLFQAYPVWEQTAPPLFPGAKPWGGIFEPHGLPLGQAGDFDRSAVIAFREEVSQIFQFQLVRLKGDSAHRSPQRKVADVEL
jgi:hypothetical protein